MTNPKPVASRPDTDQDARVDAGASEMARNMDEVLRRMLASPSMPKRKKPPVSEEDKLPPAKED